MRAPGTTAADDEVACARAVNNAAKILAGWLRVEANAVENNDSAAAEGARRNGELARAELRKCERALTRAQQDSARERRSWFQRRAEQRR